MKETWLAQKFVDYFSCYDLYFEVDYFRCIDIVAISDKFSIGVEVKTSFNFKVLEQAISNTRTMSFSYIAVPHTKDMSFQRKLCRDYGVGLLVYYEHLDKVKELEKPRYNRYCRVSNVKSSLSECNKICTPGSKNGDSGKITAFGVTVDSAVRYVRRNPGCSMKKLIENITHHYNSDQVAIRSIQKWIKSGVIKELIIKDKKLYINKNESINN